MKIISKEEVKRIQKLEDVYFRLNQNYWFSEFDFLDPIFEYLYNGNRQIENARSEFREKLDKYIGNLKEKIHNLQEQLEEVNSQLKSSLDTIELKKNMEAEKIK